MERMYQEDMGGRSLGVSELRRGDEDNQFYNSGKVSLHHSFYHKEILHFIASITQHIPEKSFQLVRYYGWYSNRGRGEREKKKQITVNLPEVPTRVEIIDVSDYRPKKIPSPKWRECIRKVWEVDPLSCPKCGSEMKIISFINEADVIRR